MAVSYDWGIARENMKNLRVSAGLSQKILGKNLDTKAAAICRYEKGETVPRIEYIQKFCMFFGVGIDDLYEPDLIEGVLKL